MTTKTQWTSEVPTQDGDYWVSIHNQANNTMFKPSLAHIHAWTEGEPNIALADGSCPQLATFVKQNPTALWCEVIPPPPIPDTNKTS